jgi:hypothetical protein
MPPNLCQPLPASASLCRPLPLALERVTRLPSSAPAVFCAAAAGVLHPTPRAANQTKPRPRPGRLERRLLGNVRFYDDFCVTHEDGDYMARMYGMEPPAPSPAAAGAGAAAADDAGAPQGDNYFVRTYPSQ